MSECVVRMEVPKGCWNCPCVNGEYGYCQADKDERQIEDPNERPSWCPIICQLPEGHGRLVDTDSVELAMVEKGQRSSRYRLGEMWELNGLEIREALQIVSTIVPAERNET